jgi:stearoyl-CoA desaturase (delta-9 desaturase)
MSTLSKVLGDMRVLGDRIDWIRLWFTGGIPILAVIIGSLWVPLQYRTAIFALIYVTVSGISVTAGKLNSSLPYWVFFQLR